MVVFGGAKLSALFPVGVFCLLNEDLSQVGKRLLLNDICGKRVNVSGSGFMGCRNVTGV